MRAEAEPLMRRMVKFLFRFTVTTGHEHPQLRTVLGNFAGLLQQIGRRPGNVLAQLNAVAEPFGIQFGGGKKD